MTPESPALQPGNLYRSFEEAPVWKDAEKLAVAVYKVTAQKQFFVEYSLRDQIRRAAVSISSNIAEGLERGTKKELVQFLNYAKGSAGELRSQLVLSQDLGYVSAQDGALLREQCLLVSRQLGAFIRSLRKLS